MKLSIAEVPSLMEDWDYINNSIDPHSVGSKSSRTNVFWICKKCGNSYPRTPGVQLRSAGLCKDCTEQKRIESYKKTILAKGSIWDFHPEAAEEWMNERNGNISLKEIPICSDTKFWWKCKECGHEWQATPAERWHKGNNRGCQKCSYKKISETWRKKGLKNEGSLAETNPELLEEWDYEKNGPDITPYTISYKYSKKVFFKCKLGHSYKQRISLKIKNALPCPFCVRKTSFAEQAIAFYLGKVCKVEQNVFSRRHEIDVLLPELHVGIEYDGWYYHSKPKQKERDKKKEVFYAKRGIKIIRVKEVQVYEGKELTLPGNKPQQEHFEKLIKDLCCILHLEVPDVNIERDFITIKSMVTDYVITNSIVNKSPELLQYWDYEGNAGVDPANVHYGSNEYYSWICPNCNKTFLRSVYLQKNAKNKFCEHCARSQGTKGRAAKRLIEQGSLFDARPDLLDFWDEKLNSGILPNEVPQNSQFKIVIKCPTCGGIREARTMDLLKIKYPCRHCYDKNRKKNKG